MKHSKKTQLIFIFIISLSTIVSLQNCGRGFNGEGVINLSSMPPLPPFHPPDEIQKIAPQQILVGGKDYVKNLISDIFTSSQPPGPDIKGLLEKWVTFNPSQFGGSCNPYDTYGGSDCGGDLTNANLVSHTDPNSLRESYRLQLCQNIMADDLAVTTALRKINITNPTTMEPTNERITAVFGLFYRDNPPNSEVLETLADLNTTMLGTKEPPLERWRALLLAICESPGWQLF